MKANKPSPIQILILIVYYLLVVLPHEQVGLLTVYLFGDLPRPTYDALILGLTSLVFTGFLWFLKERISGSQIHIKPILFYLLATFFFSMLCFKLLIIINIEAIHFIQYGILTLLLFPLIQHYGKTLFWVTLAGALDEAFQYFYLAPERTNYYDFNDVVINLIGGAFGLILVAAQGNREIPKTWALEGILMGICSILLGVLYAFGKFQIYPTDPATDPVFLLVRVPSEGFWTVVHPSITYHVVQPLEGILIIALLLIFYSQLPNWALPKH